jgi:hypothetical protein
LFNHKINLIYNNIIDTFNDSNISVKEENESYATFENDLEKLYNTESKEFYEEDDEIKINTDV